MNFLQNEFNAYHCHNVNFTKMCDSSAFVKWFVYMYIFYYQNTSNVNINMVIKQNNQFIIFFF